MGEARLTLKEYEAPGALWFQSKAVRGGAGASTKSVPSVQLWTAAEVSERYPPPRVNSD